MPSSLSALRFVAFPASALTTIGARPAGTVMPRPRAMVPPVELVLVSWRTASLTPLFRVVFVAALFVEPRTS